MSRIGKLPVVVPAGVKVSIDGGTVNIEGPKGKLSQTFDSSAVSIKFENNEIHVAPSSESRFSQAMHGTVRCLIAGMV